MYCNLQFTGQINGLCGKVDASMSKNNLARYIARGYKRRMKPGGTDLTSVIDEGTLSLSLHH